MLSYQNIVTNTELVETSTTLESIRNTCSNTISWAIMLQWLKNGAGIRANWKLKLD